MQDGVDFSHSRCSPCPAAWLGWPRVPGVVRNKQRHQGVSPSSWKISLRCPSRPPSPQTHVNRRPFSICNKPSSIAFREIISYTPIPLMDTTVESRLRSVRACITCATHSHPARVDGAYWKSAVAASASCGDLLRCCACYQATQNVTDHGSSAPPSGFTGAVTRPS